jgi:acetyl-CoA carboxylase biotin carboxyl carrier protein
MKLTLAFGIDVALTKIDEAIFEKLAAILKRHNLAEIEYAYKDLRIKLTDKNGGKREVEGDIVGVLKPESSPVLVAAAPEKAVPIPFPQHPGALKSPMVGTCYLSPEPGGPNFISLNDHVQEGQPILIIEAMKVMNIIKSSKSGKVIHIAVSNAAPVEFGQLLVVIE